MQKREKLKRKKKHTHGQLSLRENRGPMKRPLPGTPGEGNDQKKRGGTWIHRQKKAGEGIVPQRRGTWDKGRKNFKTHGVTGK